MSGISLEKYASIIGALIESTGKSGAELSNSFKMISARTLQIKSLADELDITDSEMGKAEQGLRDFGIAIREGGGDLKSLDTILEEVAGKWGTMTDQEKQYLSEAMAG